MDLIEGKAASGRRAIFGMHQAGELENISMATSESNDAFAMAADQERDVFLRRTDPHFLNRDRVVFTRVRTRAVVAQAAYDL